MEMELNQDLSEIAPLEQDNTIQSNKPRRPYTGWALVIVGIVMLLLSIGCLVWILVENDPEKKTSWILRVCSMIVFALGSIVDIIVGVKNFLYPCKGK